MNGDTTKTDALIRPYCEFFGITREQYDAIGALQEETIDALVELQKSDDDDPIIPLGLPGAGKRCSKLTDAEMERLLWNEMEFQDLLETRPSAKGEGRFDVTK